jgi:aconitate hydratase
VADAADKVAEYLTGDEEVYANPELYFDQLSRSILELEPHLNSRFTISRKKKLSNNWPLKIEVGLIGSVTLLMKISRVRLQ